MNRPILFVVAGILLLVLFVGIASRKEGFRINCPTRNMSYDLRGEAYYPPRMITPYMNSTIGPMDPRECVFREPLHI
jgi:hypothetical protein